MVKFCTFSLCTVAACNKFVEELYMLGAYKEQALECLPAIDAVVHLLETSKGMCIHFIPLLINLLVMFFIQMHCD